MATLKIDAGDSLLALDSSDDGICHYLDLETGQVIPILDGGFGPGEPEYVDIEEIEASSRYRFIESVSSRDAYRWMSKFADTVADPTLRRRLNAALERPRPFRGFKDAIASVGEVRQQWFAFHQAKLLEFASDWLASEHIAAELVDHP